MSSWRAFCHTIHLAALGIWAGAIALAAATAAVAFPTLKHMDVRIPSLPPGSESDHFRFAAGAVAQRVFNIGDIVAFGCAMLSALALLALVGAFKIPMKRPANALRALALTIAIASLAALLLVVTPSINAASEAHLAAVIAGNHEDAARHRAAVDDLHPLASMLMSIELVSVLIALLCGGWSLATGAQRSGAFAADAPNPSNPYPEPALLKRKSI